MGSNPRNCARAFTREKIAWHVTMRVCVPPGGSLIFFLYFFGLKPFSTGPCYRPVLNDVSFSTGQPVPVRRSVLNRSSRPILRLFSGYVIR